MQIRPLARTPETDEVLRAVGRNVVNLQYVEELLKGLASSAMSEGPLSSAMARHEKHVAVVRSSTMGSLAGRLLDTFLAAPGKVDGMAPSAAPAAVHEPFVSVKWAIEVDAAFRDQHAREMQALVTERNALIHHFLPRWHAAVLGDVDSALAYLDAQHAEIARMTDRLQQWSQDLKQAVQHAQWMASPEGQALVQQALASTAPIVGALVGAAAHVQRPDGWTDLRIALRHVRRGMPHALVAGGKHLGQPAIEALMRETRLFDIHREPLRLGRALATRTLYRLNDDVVMGCEGG